MAENINIPTLKSKMSGMTPLPEHLSTDFHYTAKIIRAPHPRCRIKVRELQETEGVYCLTAEDLGEHNSFQIHDNIMPLLAENEIDFEGQPVALVAAESIDKLEEFDRKSHIVFEKLNTLPELDFFKNEQILFERHLSKGKILSALKNKKFSTSENTFYTPLQARGYGSTLSVYAVPNKGGMTIHTGTQWPAHVKKTVARTLNITPGKVTVVNYSCGRSIDSRLWIPSLISAYTALLCKKTGQPVKLILNPDEDMFFAQSRAPLKLTVRAVQDDQGQLAAMHYRAILDSGAYLMYGKEILDRICYSLGSHYHCRNIQIDAYAIKTSKPPNGPLTGAGEAQAFFGLETLCNQMCRALSIRPDVWRKKNLIRKGNSTVTGYLLKRETPLREMLDDLLAKSEFVRKYASCEIQRKIGRDLSWRLDDPHTGIGLSTSLKGNGLLRKEKREGSSSIHIILDINGRLTIKTSCIPERESLIFSWKQLAGSILEMKENMIDIPRMDTDEAPDAGPAIFSRTVSIISRLIEKACNQIKKKRFRDPLPIEIKKSYSMANLSQWDTSTMSGQPYLSQSYGVCALELELNRINYNPLIKKIWMTVECGKILNKPAAESEIAAEIRESLIWCTRNTRDLIFRKKWNEQNSFRFNELSNQPEIFIDFFEGKNKSQPKGLGGLASSLIPAAFINALSQALNLDFNHFPVTTEDLLMKERAYEN